MDYMESIKKLEEKWTINQQKHTINGAVICFATVIYYLVNTSSIGLKYFKLEKNPIALWLI